MSSLTLLLFAILAPCGKRSGSISISSGRWFGTLDFYFFVPSYLASAFALVRLQRDSCSVLLMNLAAEARNAVYHLSLF